MTIALPSLLKIELDRLQFDKTDKFIWIEQIPIGFGGQISRRLLGLKLALALDRKAVFSDVADAPYLQTLEAQDVGAPDIDWSLYELFDPLAPQADAYLRFEYEGASRRLKDHGYIESWARDKIIARFELPADYNVDGEILKWMRLIPSVAAEIESARIRLGISSTTLGVHFRRGDKTVESAYVPAAHFNDAILRVFETWRFESLFLASDSPKAIEEIKTPPGVRVIFDFEEIRYNNANHKMLFRNPALAQQETYTAAKNLALLSACGGVVGQDNAHFATLSAAVVAANFSDKRRILLLHGQVAELESPSLRRYFEVKRTIRKFARACVPDEVRVKLLRFKLF
ncbi:hypothetical protein Msil_2482 [Methylocella silvestris BL2]|uniref:Uncharacterized protein n=1 Tax=Methylocella silvestris (strain DSM 15510 / CIP 108128 / LMG 27833 / NCIMB 13906 / BL2) TaxID=395965 RepID=B8EM21_METSB|nr:hypothetical protein [Methylocella silvestris]ACK51410.1 hypothetical protein Msil_2482 [Methylocella silvestris BL2]